MISIILPTYNGGKYIRKSIQSCLNQTHQDIELIIINDCSTDNTKNIVSSFNDKRIVYIENEKNLGIAESLNKGFANSKGDYLTWTSDDNYYKENAIQEMLNDINGYDFVYANFNIIDENDKFQKEIIVGNPHSLNFKNRIGACFLYTKEVYQKIGDFRKEHLYAEDYEYWLRVRKEFKMKRINKNLYSYRLHSESLTGKNKKKKIAKAAYHASKQYVCLLGKIYQYLKMIYHSI